MQALVVLTLAIGAISSAALVSLLASHSVWMALGTYALAVDGIAVVCAIVGALTGRMTAVRDVVIGPLGVLVPASPDLAQ